jgi:hypothetical protein
MTLAHTSPAAVAADEKRSEPRGRVVLNALLAWGSDHAFTPECVIRNLTSGGAAVRFSDPLRLPAELTLIELKAARAHTVRVVWRRAGFVGLAITATRDLTAARPGDPHRQLWLDRQPRRQ